MNSKVHHAPQAIFFDMDGTLLITTQRSEQSWQHVCAQFAPRLGLPSDLLFQALRESITAYRKSIELDAEKQRRDRLDPFTVRRETVEAALVHVGREDTALAEEMVRAYEALREAHRELAPHVLETLRTLRGREMRLALLTNGNASYQHRKIAHHQLASFFDCILIEEEFGTAKSDPRIYLAALTQLQVTPHEAWMVGDDVFFDIAVPQQLGIVTIWIDPVWRGLPEQSHVHPDVIIHTLPELLKLEKASTFT
jgi:putative hydrolase of the HAD superfamily